MALGPFSWETNQIYVTEQKDLSRPNWDNSIREITFTTK